MGFGETVRFIKNAWTTRNCKHYWNRRSLTRCDLAWIQPKNYLESSKNKPTIPISNKVSIASGFSPTKNVAGGHFL